MTCDELEHLLDSVLGEQAPAASLRRWFDRLPEGVQRSVEEESLQTADTLLRTLPELSALATSRIRGRLQHALHRWVCVRDDLACVAHLLDSHTEHPGQSELGAALGRLDREATAHLSAFAEVELEDDPRLRAVSWQEPEAWWGQLAVPRGER